MSKVLVNQPNWRPTRKVTAAAVVTTFSPVIAWFCITKLGMTPEIASSVGAGLALAVAYFTRERG